MAKASGLFPGIKEKVSSTPGFEDEDDLALIGPGPGRLLRGLLLEEPRERREAGAGRWTGGGGGKEERLGPEPPPPRPPRLEDPPYIICKLEEVANDN
jgi:hypothetical protein